MQSRHFLALSWQVTPWPDNLEAALKLADDFDSKMPIKAASERVKAVIKYATKTMPEADRDGRYYKGGGQGPKNELNNIGLGWSVILAYNGWELDAVRRTRAFKAWNAGSWETGLFSNKDSLGGKAEAVAGGQSWVETAQRKGGVWKSLFKHGDWLGAATLIKRVWHIAYLKKVWNLPTDSDEFPMPNTHKIAAHKPFESGDREDEEKLAGEKYFAVLALDGDEIGRWVSGEKTPPFRAQFSDYQDGSGAQREGALRYFEEHGGRDLLETKRALSPSYHLQFSQALSNFALLCAGRIVEAHDGRLIYAGGDDVLAMLPADSALRCAQALRDACQGRAVSAAGITSPAPGYLSVSKDQSGHPVAFAVPGSGAEVSVGIAIAHFKSPLQDVVRAAQV
ncbi:MAG: type III-B CRISPR-associated protein Cas10/Cmr2, partial [Verrucomicrobiaceae bacterium]